MNDITTLHSYLCDLNTGPIEVELNKPLMHQDALANTFRVAVCRGLEAVDLAGMTVYGYLYFSATRQTLPLAGVISEHYASVTLTDDCYALPGWCSLVIQLQAGDVRHAVLKVNFSVARTSSENVILPDFIGPSLPEMLDKIAAMEEATEAALNAAASVDAAKQELHRELDALEQDRASGAFDGKDGYTPVRGKDYWTAADQEAIVQQVLAALAKGADS